MSGDTLLRPINFYIEHGDNLLLFCYSSGGKTYHNLLKFWTAWKFYYLLLSKFYLPTDALKSCFKITLKFTLKYFLHVSVQSPSSGSVLFELAKVISLMKCRKTVTYTTNLFIELNVQ